MPTTGGRTIKIIVTGGSGMVGSNLIETLNSEGVEILSPEKEELDLMSRGAVNSYFLENDPDAVVHCAGLVGGIQANISRPFDFAFQNLAMGANVVEACIENGIEKLINLGSSCMYPREATNPLPETAILSGSLEPTNEGYAIAKIAVSRLCNYSNKQFGTEFKTVIPCNLYGKYDSEEDVRLIGHLVPEAIRRIQR